MSKTVTLGGDRLGSGKKQKVTLKSYERSTHDLGYIWRSTMSAGTLVPFMSKIALPGDTWDISLDCDIKTHPTIGPLFGSFKVQLDIFQAPIRLYQAQLHNNKLGIGLHMDQIKLPTIRLAAIKRNGAEDADNYQINPSCILSYLGIRGIGFVDPADTDTIGLRTFNACALLSYWDTVKNYYTNKQEQNAYAIHKEAVTIINTVDTIKINGAPLDQAPTTTNPPLNIAVGTQFLIDYTGTTPDINQILINTTAGQLSLAQLSTTRVDNTGQILLFYGNQYGNINATSWQYISASTLPQTAPRLQAFDLRNIDTTRENIMTFATAGNVPFNLNDDNGNLTPFEWLINTIDATQPPFANTQEGLAVKTYQSDLLNNWLSEEWIDGAEGINALTAIDTSGGSFTIDTLLISKKVYNMLNRIAVSGGTYHDWIETIYDIETLQLAETPIYYGGLIRELVFQEVVSNSQSDTPNSASQPLGTLAGKGIMASKRKGGHVTIKVNEPSYILGIISLTPRIDNSQGNSWDVHLETMDDLHKPEMDEIGFQDLITEQMHWSETVKTIGANTWTQKSAGKQPAWTNYMTSINEVRGNFAIANNEMFMTLNRRYEIQESTGEITDLTTYIDPAKFNFIFAQTALDAQNYWAQVAIDATVRRKMSAKVMPNL